MFLGSESFPKILKLSKKFYPVLKTVPKNFGGSKIF